MAFSSPVTSLSLLKSACRHHRRAPYAPLRKSSAGAELVMTGRCHNVSIDAPNAYRQFILKISRDDAMSNIKLFESKQIRSVWKD